VREEKELVVVGRVQRVAAALSHPPWSSPPEEREAGKRQAGEGACRSGQGTCCEQGREHVKVDMGRVAVTERPLGLHTGIGRKESQDESRGIGPIGIRYAREI